MINGVDSVDHVLVDLFLLHKVFDTPLQLSEHRLDLGPDRPDLLLHLTHNRVHLRLQLIEAPEHLTRYR